MMQNWRKEKKTVKRTLALIVVVMFVLVQAVPAQAPPQMPKPGPEHKRLGYFVGHWTSEGDMKPSAFGPGGKFSSTDHIEWFPGGFFLVLHTEEKGPMGVGKGLAMMGYKAEEKAYFYHGINSMGMTDSAKGTVQGDTWNWTSETNMGGKPMKTRFTIKELSPTSYSMKFDSSPDGRTWSTVFEGKVTKAK